MGLIWLAEPANLRREDVGGKALSINTMRTLGCNVPPAFVLTTSYCAEVGRSGVLPARVEAALAEGIERLEAETGRRFGGPSRPLLVSVRSGAALSMPGMMDTVLNVGIDADVERALAAQSGNPAYAADTRGRFVTQFEKVVGVTATGRPWDDLRAAVAAVYRSWWSPRAMTYRQSRGMSDGGGTAVTVQAMVFGNLDRDSGTGVLFSRNPLSGDRQPFGEWLPGGQGEDVVSGRHDALPLKALAARLPRVHAALLDAARRLERYAGDVQDIEFTVESGRLWLLQTRAAKRSADAAVRIAADLGEEGVVSPAAALHLVTRAQVDTLLRAHVEPSARAGAAVLAQGEPACPGVAGGRVVGDCVEAERLADDGTDVVLARPFTDPDDVSGMLVSKAILTEVGGATSHAAVLSRELDTPCVVGCGSGTLAGLVGQTVTVDGSAGEVYAGALPLVPSGEQHHPALATLARWAREQVPSFDGSLGALIAAAQVDAPAAAPR